MKILTKCASYVLTDVHQYFSIHVTRLDFLYRTNCFYRDTVLENFMFRHLLSLHGLDNRGAKEP